MRSMAATKAIAALVIVVLLASIYCHAPLQAAPTTVYKRLKFEARSYVINTGNKVWSDVNNTILQALLHEQYLFLNASDQTCTIEEASVNGNTTPYKVQEDDYGNPYLNFTLSKPLILKPGDMVYVRIVMVIDLNRKNTITDSLLNQTGSLLDIPENIKAEYPTLNASPGFRLENLSAIYTLARSLKDPSGRVLNTLINILKWFEENIRYRSIKLEPQLPSELLSRKAGDCDDQVLLFIELCRALGIPARLCVGAIYTPGSEDRSSYYSLINYTYINVGWHAWAEVLLPLTNGSFVWVPVDLTYFLGLKQTPERRLVSEDVLNHIKGAAVLWTPAIVAARLPPDEYINESRGFIKELNESGLNWKEVQLVTEVEAPPMAVQVHWWQAAMLLALASAPLIAFAAIVARSRKELKS